MSKPSTKPAHPPYSKMIVEAIAGLKQREGSSRQALVKYIKGNYTGIGDNCNTNVNKKLKVLKENGIVKEGKGGPFKFALTDAGKAKPQAKKPKPAVKKPAPKKAKKSDKKASAKKPAAKKASDKKKSTPKKAGTAKKVKTPTKKSKPKSPAKKAGKKPTPKKTGKKPAAKKSQKK